MRIANPIWRPSWIRSIETLTLVWRGTLIDSRELSSNLKFEISSVFARVLLRLASHESLSESFAVSCYCFFFPPAGSDKKVKNIMTSVSGTKGNTKAEYTGWIVARVFPGWFSFVCAWNSRQILVNSLSLVWPTLDYSYRLSWALKSFNSRSRLARALM